MVSQLQRRHRREYEKICEEYGATITLLREDGGHLVYEITQAEGTSRFVTSASPSDRRSHKNNRAKLRRILRYGEPPEPVTATPKTNGASHAEEEPPVSAHENGHAEEAPEPAAAEPEQPPIADLAQALAAQLESQVEAAVKSRIARIVGELDVLMEERSHALLMVAELDDKIAERMRVLREAAETPAAIAQMPRPPEPTPVAPPPSNPPPLPPAEAEPDPEPEPADAAPVRTLKATTIGAALVEIAEAVGGILNTAHAREVLVADGYFLKGKTRLAARINTALGQSRYFEKAEGRGQWRLLAEDEVVPPVVGNPHVGKSPEMAKLEATVLDLTKHETEPFDALTLRDRLQGTAAAIGEPRHMSARLSNYFAKSPHFERVGRGRWKRIAAPTTEESGA